MAKTSPKSPVKQTGKAKPVQPPSTIQWRYIGIVFASAFLVYANTLQHSYSLDDDIYTRKNRFVLEGFKNGFSQALSNVFAKGSLVGFNNANESNYRPIVVLNFMIDHYFFEDKTDLENLPHREHLVNVLLFGLTCVILLLLLQKMFKNYNPLLPLLITLVFVFHPVHTEVVASIKSRDEILAWLFGVCSFYYLFRYMEVLLPVKKPEAGKMLFLTLLFFFLSCLCKEGSLMFVFIVPLILYFFTDVSVKRVLSFSLVPAALIVIYALIRVRVLDSITFKDKIVIMNNGLMAAKSGGELLGTNFVILGKYLWLLICPADLTWDYSFNQVPIVTFANWKALLALALYLGMGVYTVMKWKIKDVYVFAILFYLITLFLSSNLVFKIGATMGERFLYVPSLGFCMVLVFIVLRLFKMDPRSLDWPNKSALFTLFGILFLLYGFKTFDRNKVWKNNFELFSSGLEVSTGSARAHYAIASEVRVRGEAEQNQQKRGDDFRQSVDEYLKGIAIYPDDPEVWYNLGVTYYDMGDSANARKVYAKALELRPGYNMALNNTGVLYFNQKNYPKALYYFSKIVETDTAFTDAYGNIGAAYHNMGDYKTAARYYEKALTQNPSNKSTLSNISMVYKALGDTVRANSYLQKLSTLP